MFYTRIQEIPVAVPKTKKVRMNPRKKPTQDRAQATVEALMQATAHILARDGYDHASTNRIAQAAGVSIGSLYQYFPSKEALVAALVEHMLDEECAMLEPRLRNAEGAKLETLVRELIALMIGNYAANPRLKRTVLEQVPRVGKLEKVMDLETRIAGLIELDLGRRQGVRRKDLGLAAFVIVHSVQALIHAAVFKKPEYLKDDRFVDEITDLVLRYIEK